MSALTNIEASQDNNSRSMFFWIKRDGSPFRRCLDGSITVTVPLAYHDGVLSSDCEDWCLDYLTDGVLAEWRGTELRVHFANKIDAAKFKLRWL